MTKKVHFKYAGIEYIAIGEYEGEVRAPYLDKHGDPPTEEPHGPEFFIEEIYLVRSYDSEDVQVTAMLENLYEMRIYHEGETEKKYYVSFIDVLEEAALEAILARGAE